MKYLLGSLKILFFVFMGSFSSNVLAMQSCVSKTSGYFEQIINSSNVSQNSSLIACCKIGFTHAYAQLENEEENSSVFELDLIKGYQISCLQSYRKSGSAYVAHVFYCEDRDDERIIIDHFGYSNDEVALKAFTHIFDSIQNRTKKSLAYFMFQPKNFHIKKALDILGFSIDKEQNNDGSICYVRSYSAPQNTED